MCYLRGHGLCLTYREIIASNLLSAIQLDFGRTTGKAILARFTVVASKWISVFVDQ
jgi:hypothetical protein